MFRMNLSTFAGSVINVQGKSIPALGLGALSLLFYYTVKNLSYNKKYSRNI